MRTDVKAAAESIAHLDTALTSGEKPARAFLKTLDRDTAESLVNVLIRLGWYLPSARRTAQQQLAWWLFRKDVEQIVFEGDIETTAIETPRERLDKARRDIESVASDLNIEGSSCLSVLRHVLRWLWTMEQNRSLPLWTRVKRCGVPLDHDFDDLFLIQFDGVCLNEALNRVAGEIKCRLGTLMWSSPTGHPVTTHLRYKEDMKWLLNGWRGLLESEVQSRGELPPGWESGPTGWPDRPIRTAEDLSSWLQIWLDRLHKSRANTGLQIYSPEGYLDSIQRELRNTWRAAQAGIISLPKDFDKAPAHIHAAEEQLVGMLNWLSKPDADKPASTVADPQFSHIADEEVRGKVEGILAQLTKKDRRMSLTSMMELGAIPDGHLVTAIEIARRAIDPLSDARAMTRITAELKTLQLIETYKGPKGGLRLTKLGHSVALVIHHQLASIQHK